MAPCILCISRASAHGLVAHNLFTDHIIGCQADQRPDAGAFICSNVVRKRGSLCSIAEMWGNSVVVLSCMFGLGSVLVSYEAVCTLARMLRYTC